mmetsp:Transcript_43564/g.68108  ORF Transcript_43564/g.68108 Transcript_43564/m.68108 type:complete len:205 (+) Transcript_43564:250-864(+)
MCVIPPKHLLRAKGSAHHQLSICISFYRGKLLKTANFPHHCQLPHHATAPSLPHQRAGRHFLGGGRRAVAPPTVNPYRVPAPFFLFWLPSLSSSSSSCPPSVTSCGPEGWQGQGPTRRRRQLLAGLFWPWPGRRPARARPCGAGTARGSSGPRRRSRRAVQPGCPRSSVHKHKSARPLIHSQSDKTKVHLSWYHQAQSHPSVLA